MPYFVCRSFNGSQQWTIDYREPPRKGLSERLGKELARIVITDEQASLGIDELLRRATVKPVGEYYGA